MDKLVDLHSHTTYSDGELSPNELILFAKRNNVKTLAITDHDTLEGIKNVDRSLAEKNKIELINGIELSSKVNRGRMHILGYDIDIDNIDLNKKMKELKNNSLYSTLAIINQIRLDYGLIFDYEDVRKLINENHNLGRPDVARLCIKYGYAKDVNDAFDKYLIESYNKTRLTNKGINYQECIELIKKSNGLAVLAHPKSLELNEKEFLILLKEMIESGLDGIEVYHSSHTEEEMKYYEEIANKYNLLISGGSDYHGPFVKPNIMLGTGNNNLNIKRLSLLDEIHRRKKTTL